MFDNVFAAVNELVPKIFGDDNITLSLVWKRFRSSEFDEGKGYNVEVYDSFTLTGIRCEKEAGFRTGAQYPPGVNQMAESEVAFLFQSADMPTGISTRDVIEVGGLKYSVELIIPCTQTVTKVEAKGYA